METAPESIDIEVEMPLDPNQVDKPFKKLRKLLQKLPKQPSPELVHDIRTRARRVEATLTAFSLDQKRRGKRLLKAVTPVRKRAGKVRDIDVLTGFASTLSTNSDKECLLELLEHLGKQRFDRARKLHKTAARNQKIASQSLKRCSSAITKHVNRKKGRNDWAIDASAAALQLSTELARWPKLTVGNLHPFRLKVKELRNVLQLSGKESSLVDMLGEVKDTIGEWHDWTELGNIADEVLDHPQGCQLRSQIREEASRRFDKAIRLANSTRATLFEPPHSRRARTRPLKEQIFEASATLAA